MICNNCDQHLLFIVFCSYLFAINETGEIKFRAKENLLYKDSYTLVVEASDGGKPPRSTNVVVSVSLIGKSS